MAPTKYPRRVPEAKVHEDITNSVMFSSIMPAITMNYVNVMADQMLSPFHRDFPVVYEILILAGCVLSTADKEHCTDK